MFSSKGTIKGRIDLPFIAVGEPCRIYNVSYTACNCVHSRGVHVHAHTSQEWFPFHRSKNRPTLRRFCYHCKLFVFMFFLCFRALSTHQGGYVRATNLYYYFALAQHEKKDLVFLSAGYTSSQATSRSLRSRVSFAESLLSLRVPPSVVILL